LIGDKETLDMLFVLAWVDKYTSNSETFTEIKQRWLLELYYNLGCVFENGSLTVPEIPPLVTSTISAREGHDDFDINDVEEHLGKLPARYGYVCDAATRAEHVKQIKALKSGLEQEGNFQVSIIPRP